MRSYWYYNKEHTIKPPSDLSTTSTPMSTTSTPMKSV